MNELTIVTLGCRLNATESEVMRDHARAAGLDDAIIVNTCAVTTEAVRQATQTIRRLKRERPEARIIVTGCAAQIDPERFATLSEVDHVIGNAEKMRPETFVGLAGTGAGADKCGGVARSQVGDIMDVRETAGHLIDGFSTRARAWVEIQNGCDHRCTFCIIPYGRGPSRSVAAGAVVAQVQRFVDAGYNEVVLTGVDITSYGSDLPGAPRLGWLVRQILKHVPTLERLRLSSIDQVEVDGDLLRALAEEPRLMPHLHLSLQSGDDMILKRMKRRHLRCDAIAFCETARRLRPDIVFGADLIAGFPTETEPMFANSLELVEACDLTYLHVFPFSPRPGTPAARMPQLTKREIKARADRLRVAGDQALDRYLSRQPGRMVRVLVEGPGFGRSEDFAGVVFPERAATHGGLVDLRITGVNNQRQLTGVPL